MRNKETQKQNRTVAELRRAVQSNPQDGDAWLALAQTLAQTQADSELRQAIAKSIELLPDDYQAWVLAGLEMQHSHGTAAALQWLHHIAQHRPKLAAPRLARAQLQTADHAEAATQDFLSIIQDFPKDARAHLLLAEHLQNLGQIHAAGNQLEKALNLNPEIVQNWEALAMIRLAEGRYDAVVMAASKALDIDSSTRGARLSRAEAFRQAAQWQAAMGDYRELLKVMPDNPFLLLGLGACLAGGGDFAAALTPLKAALRIKPDFAEASLNIAMVLASQGKSSEALDHLAKLLMRSQLPKALRDQALITQAVLLEQRRLPAFLSKAAETHSLRELQDAVNLAPGILLQSDQRTEDNLRDMALASQHFSLHVPEMEHGLEKHQVAFAEACLLSRVADNAAEMMKLWQAQQRHETDSRSLDPAAQTLQKNWSLVLDRQRFCSLHSNHGSGEAWLRYWHFRMFEGTSSHLPGHFKFAPNSIGLHHTIAPQQVISSVRVMLEELYPSVPVGLSRALFQLAAINRIHAFVDGNGRMARFAFAAELERAGLPPIQWTPALRDTLIYCLNDAHYDSSFEAFREGLLQAHKSTETLFRDFSERLARI